MKSLNHSGKRRLVSSGNWFMGRSVSYHRMCPRVTVFLSRTHFIADNTYWDLPLSQIRDDGPSHFAQKNKRSRSPAALSRQQEGGTSLSLLNVCCLISKKYSSHKLLWAGCLRLEPGEPMAYLRKSRHPNLLRFRVPAI